MGLWPYITSCQIFFEKFRFPYEVKNYEGGKIRALWINLQSFPSSKFQLILYGWERDPSLDAALLWKDIVAFVRFHFVEQTIFHQKSTFFKRVLHKHLLKWIWNKPLCVIFLVEGKEKAGFKFACLSNCFKKRATEGV